MGTPILYCLSPVVKGGRPASGWMLFPELMSSYRVSDGLLIPSPETAPWFPLSFWPRNGESVANSYPGNVCFTPVVDDKGDLVAYLFRWD